MSLAPTSIPFKDSSGNPHDRLMMEDAADKLSAVMVEHPEQRAALIAALETREDGNDATQGAKADVAWDGAVGPASIVSILKAIWAKLAGTLTVTGPVTNTQLRAAPVIVSGPLTDDQLRAAAVPVQGPLTDAQMRAAAVPVSGPVTDAQLRASAVPVSGPLTDAQLRAAALPVSGPLTNDQLRAAGVPLGDSEAHIGQVGGHAVVASAVPAVTASSAYATGQLIGGKLAFANFGRIAGGTGLMQMASIMAKTAQSFASDLVLFHSDPTSTTFVDKTAFALDPADFDKIIGVIPISSWTALGIPTFAQATQLAMAYKVPAGQTTIYAALIARGTPTFLSTSDIKVALKALLD